MNKKKVLFLYFNQPQPLPVHMLNLLGRQKEYDVSLLYFKRLHSPISIPLSGLLNERQVSMVTWQAGNNLFSKIANRCIICLLFIRKIRTLQPDVIHAWNLEMLIYARLAALIRKKTKIVFSLQDTTNWMLPPLARAIQRWIYRRVDLFFVTSQGFEDQFLRLFHLIAGKQTVVYMPNVPPRAQFAHFEPRNPADDLTIGYIGTLRGEEGIRTLVEAVRLARARGANIKILFAGTGKERELIKKLAQENAFIDYAGPYKHDTQILELYGRVDLVYALYDRSYDKKIHLAYRLCEAVNCRLPSLAAKGTHMAEVVESHGIGMNVVLGDVEELAQVLRLFYQYPEERKRIAVNCQKVRPEFEFETYRKRICGAYKNMLDDA